MDICVCLECFHKIALIEGPKEIKSTTKEMQSYSDCKCSICNREGELFIKVEKDNPSLLELKIEALKIEEEDIISVTIPEGLSLETLERIKSAIERTIGGSNKILFLEKEISIKALKIENGDIVTVTVPEGLDSETLSRIRGTVERTFIGLGHSSNILLIEEGIDIEVDKAK